MYEHILKNDYSKLRVEYADKANASYLRKTVALKGCDVEDTVSNNSDLLVYYDSIDGKKVLLLVERVPKQEFETEKQIEDIIVEINKSLSGYTASYSLSDDGEFVDFTVVLNSVQEAVK